ncbi:DUF6498-containing protein [Natrinema gari]|uniref:DUF6498-containing protein n=1 Tax=Natrinema gari TaxID=419186 RepID=UPI000677DFC8|nr:DUF6498-containing protein [Natrinema gari]
MSEKPLRRNERTPFFPIAVATVLPVGGSFLLDWSPTAVVLLYWLEAVTVILFYGGLAMFATPERRIEEREERWTSGRVIPPVYSENLRDVAAKTIVGLLIAVATGGSITVWGIGRGAVADSDESVIDFFAQFTVFEVPSVLAIGLFIVGTHLVTLSRYYYGTGRYRELTASMALDVQENYYALYLYFALGFVFYAVAMFFIIGLGLPASMPDSTVLTAWKVVVAGTFLALKLAFEWSRYRGERRPDIHDDDSFTANFSPTPPPEGNTI